ILREIRRRFPKLVVVMCSAITERAGTGSLEECASALRRELIPKLKQSFTLGYPAPCSPARVIGLRRAVGIGVSTGGPIALETIVAMLPAEFSVPVFIVQHMPKGFTRLLAERLQTLTSLRVVEATDGEVVSGGTVYIAPGNLHMHVTRQGSSEKIRLGLEDPENGCRPAVDALFRSLAEVYGGSVVAVILTGMGQDGLRGAKRLREKGAYIVAQNEASSVVWGMPGCVAQAGLAHAVVPLNGV